MIITRAGEHVSSSYPLLCASIVILMVTIRAATEKMIPTTSSEPQNRIIVPLRECTLNKRSTHVYFAVWERIGKRVAFVRVKIDVCYSKNRWVRSASNVD